MTLSDRQGLARALGVASHPLRLDLLDAFTRGLVASPTEAALLLGASLPNVSHHLHILQREGYLAIGGVEISEGSPGARYQATERARNLVEALATVR
jgi:hypothetical protein